MEYSWIIPSLIWGIFGLVVGFLTPFFVKDKVYRIILVALLPILGSFFIGAMLYIIYEPGFGIFNYNGYLLYGLMHSYYGLMAGLPSSIVAYLLNAAFFRS